MSFVIKSGNKQYIVNKGQQVIVDRINQDEGSEIDLPVLFSYGDSKETKFVKVKVVKHQKGKKIRILKYKAKSNYKRSYGYRHYETIIEIQ